jgi:hypothetical protein
MVLVVLARSVPNSGSATWYLWLLFTLGYLSFPTVGPIIAVRRPANPLGGCCSGSA